MKALSVHGQQRNPNSSAYATTTRTRMWTNAQRDGSQPNIGGALLQKSVIPFLVPRCKVSLTLAAGRAVTLPI